MPAAPDYPASPDKVVIKRALISVSDQTGLIEALGRRAEAKAHLFELVRKADKYGRLPEFNEAKVRLRAWGEVVP